MSNGLVVPLSTNFRNLGDSISPTWLLGPIGQAYRYSMAILWDALADAGAYAIRAGLPHYAPSDAFTWIGQDRQIAQGFAETSTSYQNRLVQWLDLWRHAGSNMGVLLAVLGYCAPSTPKVTMVQSGRTGFTSIWDSYAAGANPFPPGQTNPTPPAHLFTSANWRWDSLTQPFYAPWMWWRAWLIIDSSSGAPFSAPSKVWASGASSVVNVVVDATYGTKYVNASSASAGVNTCTWGDGTCWGWGGTNAQAKSLTALATQWKSAGCWIPWIIVSWDATQFDQTQAFGSNFVPNGKWGYWGNVVADGTYGTKYQSARYACSTASFITGTNDGPPLAVLGAG